MWTLTWQLVFWTLLVLVGAYALHMWIGVRRSGDQSVTFWGTVKKRWDLTIAFVIAAAPVAWSAILDTVVIVANFLANVFPALSGVDLSVLMLSDQHKALIQLGALLMPILRDAIQKSRGK